MPSDRAMQMAREHNNAHCNWHGFSTKRKEADAALAALLDAERADEREACARVADNELSIVRIYSSGDGRYTYAEGRIANIAAAIRARKGGA